MWKGFGCPRHEDRLRVDPFRLSTSGAWEPGAIPGRSRHCDPREGASQKTGLKQFS
jgi:hypothetical protein